MNNRGLGAISILISALFLITNQICGQIAVLAMATANIIVPASVFNLGGIFLIVLATLFFIVGLCLIFFKHKS